MRWLLELLRVLLFPRHRPAGMVRPWALAAPVLVLVFALPLLRPIRQPDPRAISDEEQALLGTTQALVEDDSLALDRTSFWSTRRAVTMVDSGGVNRTFADQPPTMAVLLSVSYRLMRYYGLTFERDAPTVAYLLTLLGVTLPAACSAGLIYRMGRLFELRRPRRFILAIVAVFGTGLFSYSTVLNVHVPAATLLLASAACLMHLTIAVEKPLTPLWLYAAGLCAALAAVIDPSALPFVPVLAAVVLMFKWKWWLRVGALYLFLIGMIGPLAIHTIYSWRATGDVYQGIGFAAPHDQHGAATAPSAELPLEDPDEPPTFGRSAGKALRNLGRVLFGTHGLLSHFPVLAIGVLGVTMIMHRHWPQSAKVLAGGTVGGAVFLMVAYAVHRPPEVGWRDAMYAARWFVVFGPLLLFWAGAWLRRSHRTGSWIIVSTLAVFSVVVGAIGAIDPWPRDGYQKYTAYEAARQVFRGDAGRR